MGKSTSEPTRRTFLRGLTTAVAASTAPAWIARTASAAPVAVGPPQAVIKDRAPLTPGAFFFLPLGSIRPRGWLQNQLRIQASGLSGHLYEIWPDVGPNSGWLGGTGESWERGPYYLNGLLPLAYLTDEPRLKALAQRFVDWTLDHPWPNGMIGPTKNDDWWPRIVMLLALTQYQELTGDPRVLPLMDRYFRYQLATLPSRPLRDWGKFRWQDNVLSVLWLYNRTGAPYLLDLARLLHQQGYDWIADFAHFQYTQPCTAAFLKLAQGQGLSDSDLATHGVNNGQALKTGAVWSLVSGSAADRAASARMLAELTQYHGLPNGMFSCDEHLAGRDPSHGSELCTVVESMFSLERALAITGSAALGDRLEKLAFNALPGTLTDDMWAHQYNQEPNQVECSLHQKPWVSDGPESNLFGLAPNFGCCTANYHQGWPKFTNSLWMLSGAPDHDRDDGLVAAAYAPCEVTTLVRGTAVTVTEETDYPFRGAVALTVNPEKPLAFPLQLRIPEWASGTTIRVNGQSVADPQPGTFARLDRTWRAGDRVEIAFPMHLRTSRWFHEAVAVERGSLVFSLQVGEDWVKLQQHGEESADWQVFPTHDWNYALAVDPAHPETDLAVTETPVGSVPFSAQGSGVRIAARGRQVTSWVADDGAANPLPESPVASECPEERLTLLPYAAAKLRITAFPVLKS
ncbi:MAG: beta-L-arabinofuranosidase domain-containing protein [Acidobacteriaceae bacterium]